MLVNTCGFIQAAKQDSIDELLGAAGGGAAVVAAGCLAERYGSGLAEALPEAQVLSFDDYGDIAARLDDVVAGRRWAGARAAGPAQAAAAHPGGPAGRTAAPCARPRARHRAGPAAGPRRRLPRGRDPGPAAGRGPGLRAAGHAAAARRRARRAAQDRLGLRPAVQLLRHPGVPRRVRLPPGCRPGRRGRLAGRARRPRAVPGQRELHLLRQGPGRPAAAGDAAAAARRRAGHRPGPGQLPAAGRGPAGPGRGHGGHARAWRPTSTCPSSTPAARCCARCGGSATASGSWA